MGSDRSAASKSGKKKTSKGSRRRVANGGDNQSVTSGSQQSENSQRTSSSKASGSMRSRKPKNTKPHDKDKEVNNKTDLRMSAEDSEVPAAAPQVMIDEKQHGAAPQDPPNVKSNRRKKPSMDTDSEVGSAGSCAQSAESEVYSSQADSMENRRQWWELLKVMYCDAYHLMFEEEAIYFEEEQEIALWRAQILMFFFTLQTLFEVSWEAHRGLERVLQVFSPPFANLPLQPPQGMESAGALIRGLAERARLAGEPSISDGARNLAIEAGEFQEAIREAFKDELFGCKNIQSLFDEDGDGEVTIEEFIEGIARLATTVRMHFKGVPKQSLDIIIRDLAKELFYEIDDDRNGVLTQEELREAILERQSLALEREKRQKELRLLREIKNRLNDVLRQIPGTKAHREWQEEEKKRVAKVRQDYKKYLEHRHRVAASSREKAEYAGRAKKRGSAIAQEEPRDNRTATMATKDP